MNIYKLKYADKETAISDLKAKELMLEEGYGIGVHAIVEIGRIIKKNGTYDSELKEITPAVYADGYALDIMCEQDISFGDNEVFPSTSSHSFAGHETILSNPILNDPFLTDSNIPVKQVIK
tara:strand:+ start:1492 stop:1854 length:363 start_codon:yes stop_codon:yes gene_type:complete